jgi:hypothetical protein
MIKSCTVISSVYPRTVFYNGRPQTCIWKVKVKGKAIPLQALIGPEGSKKLRLTDFKTVGT